MSYFDEASFILLPHGGAGKGGDGDAGKAYAIKPIEKVADNATELAINGDFAIDGPGSNGELSTGFGSYGWNTVATDEANNVQEGTTTIKNGVLKLSNASGDVDTRAYLTDGVSTRNVLTQSQEYLLKYTVVENNGCTDLRAYNDAGNLASAPHTVGTHYITIKNTQNQLFLFDNRTEDSDISIDNVSLKELEQRSFDIPFDRGTNLAATRVDKDGNVEKGIENLLTHSNELDNADSWVQGATLTSGQKGYDGTNNAWNLRKTTATGNFNHKLTFTGMHTFSIHVKKQENAGIAIYNFWGSPSTSRRTIINLSDGTEQYTGGSPVTHTSVIDLGNGWWRIAATNITDSAGKWYIYTSDGTDTLVGDDSNPVTITVQDIQLETGIGANKYVESTSITGKTGVLTDEPRFDYSGGGDCPQLLLETSRSNKVKWSEYYKHSTWDSQTRDGTLTWKGGEKNPSGYYGCYEFECTGNDNQLGVAGATNLTATPADGKMITNSIYVKRVSGTGQVQLRDTNNIATNFDLSVADGWKRLVVTAAADANTPDGISSRHYFNITTVGDKVLVWGSQYEEGTSAGDPVVEYGYVTSYIPTNGAAATRSQDACNSDTPINLADDDFTVFLDIEEYKSGGVGLWSFDYANGGNALFHYNDCIGWWSAAGSGNEEYQCNAFGSNKDERHRFLISSDAQEIKVYRDGELIRHDTSIDSTRYGLQRVKLLYGTMNSARYNAVFVFPKVLSNTESEILSGADSYTTFELLADSLSNYTIYE